ncbi:hypothetical protein, partial [Actinomadura roseirufa]|uniref:hypothetical protein n=1 Tax=Actinomadura roseirufa TaxID=2094049 RepID=UPI001A9556CF
METIAAGVGSAGLACPDGAAPARPGGVPAARWVRRAALACVLLAALATVTILIFGTAPARPTAAALAHTRWGFLPVLVLLAVLHYVFAALALRGAAGHRLPLTESTLAQFTAAAANRVTPSGLGADVHAGAIAVDIVGFGVIGFGVVGFGV